MVIRAVLGGRFPDRAQRACRAYVLSFRTPEPLCSSRSSTAKNGAGAPANCA
jgi:hypothetical protein